jgi:hypothetical protein
MAVHVPVVINYNIVETVLSIGSPSALLQRVFLSSATIGYLVRYSRRRGVHRQRDVAWFHVAAAKKYRPACSPAWPCPAPAAGLTPASLSWQAFPPLFAGRTREGETRPASHLTGGRRPGRKFTASAPKVEQTMQQPR